MCIRDSLPIARNGISSHTGTIVTTAQRSWSLASPEAELSAGPSSPLQAVRGSHWGRLGLSEGPLRPSWISPEAFLGASWAIAGPSCRALLEVLLAQGSLRTYKLLFGLRHGAKTAGTVGQGYLHHPPILSRRRTLLGASWAASGTPLRLVGPA
eukprot:1891089-Pyramimonas_sp.AAC.1